MKSDTESDRTIYSILNETCCAEITDTFKSCFKINIKPADFVISTVICLISIISISLAIGTPLIFIFEIDVRKSDEIIEFPVVEQDERYYDVSYSQFYDRTEVKLLDKEIVCESDVDGWYRLVSISIAGQSAKIPRFIPAKSNGWYSWFILDSNVRKALRL